MDMERTTNLVSKRGRVSGSGMLAIVISSVYYSYSGGYWTTTSYNYEMWLECLESWNQVTIIAPVVEAKPPAQAIRADGPGVTFAPVIASEGIAGALAALPSRFWQLRNPIKMQDALVLHVPGDLGTLAYFWAQLLDKPCGLDIRGSQAVDVDYLQERRVRGAKAVASIFSLAFKWVRSSAVNAIYVSEELKRRFPLPEGHTMSVFSDIRLPEWWFTGPRSFKDTSYPLRICTVGRLEAQKGLPNLLRAFAEISSSSEIALELELIGNGPQECELRMLVERLGLSKSVTFSGFIPWGSALHHRLLDADLFVLASNTEGMPRVVIEAMATGLPVVSTSVGGIPEILATEDIVPPMNIALLREKLKEVVASPTRLSEMSRRNFERSKEFYPDRLRAGKVAFYNELFEACSRQH